MYIKIKFYYIFFQEIRLKQIIIRTIYINL